MYSLLIEENTTYQDRICSLLLLEQL